MTLGDIRPLVKHLWETSDAYPDLTGLSIRIPLRDTLSVVVERIDEEGRQLVNSRVVSVDRLDELKDLQKLTDFVDSLFVGM